MECVKSEPFALQVIDRSMEPEFPLGCVIVIEPDALLEDGCFVVAWHQGEAIFRQLSIDGEHWRLLALQPGYAVLKISGLADIRGRVVQRAGKKRKDRKRYV